MGITVAVLVLVGIVMVFSSSAVYALEKYNDSYYFLKRQAVWCLLGTGVLLVVKNLDYHKLHQYTYPIMLATFLLLLAVMFPDTCKSPCRGQTKATTNTNTGGRGIGAPHRERRRRPGAIHGITPVQCAVASQSVGPVPSPPPTQAI